MSASLLTNALPLEGWENFYVIVGSSAAALIGLTFIVITLAADNSSTTGMGATARLRGLRAFITPTAVYFGTALWVAALLTVPGQTALTLGVCLAVSALVGLAYWARVVYLLFGFGGDYKPFLSDWIWSAILPLLAYLALLATAVLLFRRVPVSLYAVAGATLLMVFIGIHNAWDVVVWMTTERHARRERERHAEGTPAAQRDR
ncbi:MAG TPA: hypothetical protein VMU67_06000 [Steroidobacteraceae bacterium]|nr:hypothetical protein [Steroidobacteraceae bacterium]